MDRPDPGQHEIVEEFNRVAAKKFRLGMNPDGRSKYSSTFRDKDFAAMKSILIEDDRLEKLARTQWRESDKVSRALHVNESKEIDKRWNATGEGAGWKNRSETPSSENKVFVRNLSWVVTDHDLRDMFAKTGTVVDAQVAKDRVMGKSRGYGFVTFSSSKEAGQAIKVLNGREL